MNLPQPATFVPAETGAFRYVEKSSPHTSNLQFLTYGAYELNGVVCSGTLAHPGEESLLFCWQGQVTALLNGARYVLEHYDVLYIPRGASYQLAHECGASKVIVCRATADMTVQRFPNDGFWLHAHEAVHNLAVLEDEQGRDAADAKGLAQLLLLVGVDLHQLEAAGVLGLDLFQQRADHLARAAPGGPKVDQHGRVHRGIHHLRIEVFNGHIHHGNQLGLS